MGKVRRWGRETRTRALRRMWAAVPTVVESALAATLAWIVAVYVVEQPRPFFAPISAVVTLTAARGERGATAVRLVFGVVIGILAADLVLFTLGSPLWALPVSIFIAMMAATALHTARVILVQSASSAILTVVFASGAAGWQRLVEALIGAGIALLIIQVLLPPNPVRMLRRSVKAVLADLAAGLDDAARAMEHDDEDAARRAKERLWEEDEHLSDLAQARRFSRRVAQRILARRGWISQVREEGEHARMLKFLHVSCVLLLRAAFSLTLADRERFAPVMRRLTDALNTLAGDPAGPDSLRTAADQALDAIRPFERGTPAPDPSLSTAVVAARMVAADVLIFAGSAPDEAVVSVHPVEDEPAVPPPPAE